MISLIHFRIPMLLVVISMVTVCCVNESEARPRRTWTYETLWSESELVCIGVVKSTKLVENKEFLPQYLNQLESEVLILSVLKGEMKNLSAITFVHYRYRPDISTTLGNGPSFAILRDHRTLGTWKEGDGPVEIAPDKKSSTTFLFYLKRRTDGKFGPITGDDDASISVAQIIGYTDDEVLRRQK